MNRVSALPGLGKEVRALLPTWLASSGVMIACALMSVPGLGRLRPGGFLAYVLGCVSVGSLAMGHEYGHRTLTHLLAQPMRRSRLLLTKLTVLAPMMASLAGLAWLLGFAPGELFARAPQVGPWTAALAILPALSGLALAPWLTMMTRSGLAAIVFTLAAPASIWVAAEAIGIAAFGWAERYSLAALALKVNVSASAMLALTAMAAMMAARAFLRLEDAESRGTEVHLPVWARVRSAATSSARRRHPIWLLTKKELRLQQITFAVAGLYVLAFVTVALIRDSATADARASVTDIAPLYSILVALIAGAVASAEERQFGVLEWQALLPMAARTQWLVKVAVVLGLVVLLALGLPWLVAQVDLNPSRRFPMDSWMPAGLILIAAGGLYVSSVSSSGLRALIVSFPVLLGGVFFFLALLAGLETQTMFQVEFRDLHDRLQLNRRWYSSHALLMRTLFYQAAVAVILGMTAVLLWFASANHRSAERAPERISRQAIWILMWITVSACLLGVASALYRVGLNRSPLG